MPAARRYEQRRAARRQAAEPAATDVVPNENSALWSEGAVLGSEVALVGATSRVLLGADLLEQEHGSSKALMVHLLRRYSNRADLYKDLTEALDRLTGCRIRRRGLSSMTGRSTRGHPTATAHTATARRLEYVGRPFGTVTIEVAPEEVGALTNLETIATHDAVDWFDELGLPALQPVPALPLPHQIAR